MSANSTPVKVTGNSLTIGDREIFEEESTDGSGSYNAEGSSVGRIPSEGDLLTGNCDTSSINLPDNLYPPNSNYVSNWIFMRKK